jgi:hypothetical protein
VAGFVPFARWWVGLGAAIQAAMLWQEPIGLLTAAGLGALTAAAWRALGAGGRSLLACASLGGAGMLLGGLLDTGRGDHLHVSAHWPPGYGFGLMLLGCTAGCWLVGACKRSKPPLLGLGPTLAGLLGMLTGMQAAALALPPATPGWLRHLAMLAGMLAGTALAQHAAMRVNRAVASRSGRRHGAHGGVSLGTLSPVTRDRACPGPPCR